MGPSHRSEDSGSGLTRVGMRPREKDGGRRERDPTTRDSGSGVGKTGADEVRNPYRPVTVSEEASRGKHGEVCRAGKAHLGRN
jgi:hypothetical protein